MTEDEILALPYRPCVGIMVCNRFGGIFAGQRLDSSYDAWQMPQGGIEPGEDPRAAALRENLRKRKAQQRGRAEKPEGN